VIAFEKESKNLKKINRLLDVILRCQTLNLDSIFKILGLIGVAKSSRDVSAEVTESLEMLTSELNVRLKGLYVEKFDLTLKGQDYLSNELDKIEEALDIFSDSFSMKINSYKDTLSKLTEQIQADQSLKTTSDLRIKENLRNLTKKVLKEVLPMASLDSIKRMIEGINLNPDDQEKEQKKVCLLINYFFDLNSIESEFFECILGKLNQDPDCLKKTLDAFKKGLETPKDLTHNRFIDQNQRILKYLVQFLGVDEQMMLTLFAQETPPQWFNENLAEMIRTKPPGLWSQEILTLADYTIADMTLARTESLDFSGLKLKFTEYQKKAFLSPNSVFLVEEKENFEKKYLPVLRGEEISKENFVLLKENEEDTRLEEMRKSLMQVISFRSMLNSLHIDMMNQKEIYEFNALIVAIWEKMKDCNPKLNIPQLVKIFSEIQQNEDIEQITEIIRSRRCENWHRGLCSARLISLLQEFTENKGLKRKQLEEIQAKFEKKAREILRWPILSEFMYDMIQEELRMINPNLQVTIEEVNALFNKFISLRRRGYLSDEKLSGIKGKSIQEVRIILRELQLIGELDYKEGNSYQKQIIASLVRLDQRYGQEMIDRFVSLLKNVETPDLVSMASLLGKISSGRLLLDNKVLEMNKNKTVFDFEKKLMTYSNKKNSIEMDANSLTQQMAADPYNEKVFKLVQNGERGSTSVLEKSIKEVLNERATSKLLRKLGRISDWSKENIHEWKRQLTYNFVQQNIVEVFQVLVRAVRLCYPYGPRLTQLASALLFWEGEREGRGRLAQVGTGEGKSLIIAMWAIVQCLLNKEMNKRVDIITSSSVLAKRDAEESRKFYEFMGLSVENNCDEEAVKSLETRKKRYECDILYGDIASFQRDSLLNSPFFNQDILGSRTTCCLIVDEVDSMLLDKGDVMLYLSQNIPELNMLKQLYAEIWIAVHGKTELEGTETDINNVVRYIRLRIQNHEIKIPNYLKEFVEKRLLILVRSAYMAKNMDEDDSYVYDATNKSGRVVVMDKDTGVEQDSTQWSNGLHQFLQLKNLDKFRPESLRAVFKSNFSTFSDGPGKVFGLSGTLGSHVEREFLERQYKVDFFNIPRFKPSRYFEEEQIIASDEGSWLNNIKVIINKQSTKRPILFICENVNSVKNLEKNILRYHKSEQVYSHFSSYAELKVGTDKIPLKAGDVLIATNIAGRGIDLAVSKDIEKGEGLHVVLTFIPINMRIEQQAYGRTARKGLPGTGQFCVLAEEDATIDILKQIRDKSECERLQQLKLKNLQRTEMEENLFKKFTLLYKSIAKSLKLTTDVDLQLAALKNRWAFFLESITEQLDMIYLGGTGEILKLYGTFEQNVRNDMQSGSYKLLKSPVEITKLGHLHASAKKYTEAIGCFDHVIQSEPNFSEAALCGKVYSLRKNNTNVDSIRNELSRLLKQANELIEDRTQEVAVCLQGVKTIDKIRQASSKGGKVNYLEEQTNGYTACYQVHARAIKTAIGSIVNQEVIRVTYPGCKDDDDAKSLFDYIRNNSKLLKDLRFSKKAKVDEDNSLSIKVNEKHRKVQFSQSIAHYEEKIIKVIGNKLGNKSLDERQLKEPEKLFEFVYDKEKLWKDFVENGNIQEKGEVTIISYVDDVYADLNLESFEEHREFLKNILKAANHSECKFSLFKEKILEQDFTKLIGIFDNKKLIQKTKKGLFTVKRNADSSLIVPQSNSLLKSYFELMGPEEEGQEIFMSDLPAPDSVSIAVNEIVFFLTSQKVLKEVKVNFPSGKSREENITFLEGEVEKLNINSSDGSLAKITLIIQNSKIKENQFVTQLLKEMKDYAGLLKHAEGVNIDYKDVSEYFSEEPTPQEYFDLKEMGMNNVLVFDETKSWKWNWSAFAVMMLGCLEIAAGIALTVCTAGFGAFIGNMLISEGVSDFTYGLQAMISGEFSWAQYGVHKAVSMAISIVTCGVGAYFSSGATAAGSLLKTATVQMAKSAARKLIAKAIFGKFVKTMVRQLASVGMNIAVDKVREALIDKILDNISEMIVKTTDELIEKEYGKLKKKIDELFNASSGFQQAMKNIESINTKVMQTLSNSFVEISNLVLAITEKAAETVKAVAEEADSSNASLATLLKVVKLVPTIIQITKFVQEMASMETYISNFMSEFSKKIEERKRDFEQKKANSTPNKESKGDFDKSVTNILDGSKRQLKDFLKEKINNEIQGLASSVLSAAANNIVNRALEKTSNYMKKKYFNESSAKWDHVVSSHETKKALARKGDIEGMKQEDEQAAHTYIGTWRNKQHLDSLSSQDTVNDHLNKYSKSRLGYDEHENVVVVKKQTYQDTVHDIILNERNAGAIHQQIASDKVKRHIEVINEQGEVLHRTSPLDGKVDKDEPIRLYLSVENGEHHFYPILSKTNKAVDLQVANLKKTCLYDSIMFSDEMSKGCSINEAFEKVHDENYKKAFQKELMEHALTNEKIKASYDSGYHDSIKSFHGGARDLKRYMKLLQLFQRNSHHPQIAPQENNTRRSQEEEKNEDFKVINEDANGIVTRLNISRPSGFNPSTNQHLQIKQPEAFHDSRGRKIVEIFQRCHDLPWMAMKMLPVACFSGNTKKDGRELFEGSVEKLVSEKTFKNIKAAPTAEKALRIYVLAMFNNPLNIYAGYASKNMSEGTKIRGFEAKVLSGNLKAIALQETLHKMRDSNSTSLLPENSKKTHEEWVKNFGTEFVKQTIAYNKRVNSNLEKSRPLLRRPPKKL